MSFLVPTPLLSQLPWFHPYLEVRERFERHLNPTFTGPAKANRSDLYNRYRLGARFDIAEHLTATAEYQNATDLFWTDAKNGIGHNSDVSLAFLDYKTKDFDLSAGREKIALGEMRLIGPTEWTNLSRSFDVARGKWGAWDLWGGTLGMANNHTGTVRLADLTHSDRTWGVTSLILKHDKGALGSIDDQTLDHFVSVSLGKTRLDGELALQGGSNNLKDQNAWAYHAKVTQDLGAQTSASLEADAASGGSNSNTSRTFDNLYPSNHNLYGLADTTGWKNMTYFGAKIENRSVRNLTLKGAAQNFSLRDPADAWYNFADVANPRPGGVFQDPTGKSGTDLGNELDLEAIYDLKNLGKISGGLGYFMPGGFVKKMTGHSDSMTFLYLQYEARF